MYRFVSATLAILFLAIELQIEMCATQNVPYILEDDLIPMDDSYSMIGQYYFGGLFNIHYSQGGKCREIDIRGLQRMYAMVYAVDRINNRHDILPNISIGFDLHDTCSDPNIAVAASLDFITSSSENQCNGGEDLLRDFVGVVGPPSSNPAVSVANLFGLFKIPAISFSATSSILSENRYEYFTRTVPTDSNQATALADIAEYYGWSVVAAISTDDLAYGIDGRDLFIEEAAKRNICVAYTQQISSESSVEFLESIVRDLRKLPNIKVIIAFAYEAPMLKLFEVFESHNATEYTWLGTDAWTNSVTLKNSSLTSVAKGMLGLALHSEAIDGFDPFLQSRSPASTQFRDPFIIKYWEDTFKCYLTKRGKNEKGYKQKCSGNETLPADDILYNAPVESAILDSVEVVAKALHEILGCNSSKGCKEMAKGVPGDLMLQCMKNVNFTGYSDYRIDFSDNGDLLSEAWYDVMNLQPVSNCTKEFDFRRIGHWRRSKGGLWEIKDVFWGHQSSCDKEPNEPPTSFCSRSCHPGERRTSQGLSLCCWDCVKCPTDHYSDTFDAINCNNCSEEQISNANHTGCIDLEEIYLNLTDTLSLVMISIACVGIILTSAVLCVFVIKRKVTIVYYACAESHVFTILFAIILCFCCAGVSLIPASELSCVIINGVQMLPITLLQGFLILTSYINYKKKSDQSVPLIKQILVILLVTILHGALVTAWYFTSTPEVSRNVDKEARKVYVDCGSGTIFDTKTILFLYSIVLDCVGIAIANNIKDSALNFYEGKFVFYTFVIHIMLWVTTLATYLAITPGKHYQPIIVSIGMLLSGFVILGSIYVPKLYILKTKTEANEIVKRKEKKYEADSEDDDRGQKSMQAIKSDPSARKILLDNYRKAIEAFKGEKQQSVRVATICNDKIEEIQLRYRNIIGTKKNDVQRMRHQKLSSVVRPPLTDSTNL